LKLILVVGGLGRPHESTKPQRVRAREGANGNADFFYGGVREWLREGSEQARV
jgi:hypothetical protein